MGDFCEDGIKPFGYIEGEEFLNWLVKKAAAWCLFVSSWELVKLVGHSVLFVSWLVN